MSTTNHHYNLRNRQTKRKRLDEPNQSIEENKEKETEYIAPDLKPALEESSDSECSSEDPDQTETLDEDDEDEKKDEEWRLNRRDLCLSIFKTLAQHIPNFSVTKLAEISADLVAHADENIIKEYCTAVPADKKWKLGLTEEQIVKLEPILVKLRSDIQRDIPTVEKILESPMAQDEKKIILKKYDILMNLEPYTVEYYEQESEIHKKLVQEQKAKEKSNVEIEQMEREYKTKLHTMEDSSFTMKRLIYQLDASEEIKLKIYDKFLKYQRLEPTDSEARDIKEWLYYCVNLPYNKIQSLPVQFGRDSISAITKFCTKVYEAMNIELYGMHNVKLKLISVLNNRITNGKTSGCITGLVGGPGTGKSTITKVFAKAIGFPFDRLSMGGLEDASILKGSDSVWMGATPSIILQMLGRMKISDGVIQIDEIDKIPNTEKGQAVYHALLHILDPSQNDQVRDSFLSEFLHDMSRIWFFPTMNSTEGLNPALLDRMEIIQVNKYSKVEQKIITEKFVLPKILKQLGFGKDDILFSKDGLDEFFQLLEVEISQGGIRPIERYLKHILSIINLVRTLDRTKDVNMKMDFNIPLYKEGYQLDREIVQELTKNIKNSVNDSVQGMYL